MWFNADESIATSRVEHFVEDVQQLVVCYATIATGLEQLDELDRPSFSEVEDLIRGSK